MAKKKAKKAQKHQSFKITPPKPTYNRIFFYMVAALFIGIVIGAYFEGAVNSALVSYAQTP